MTIADVAEKHFRGDVDEADIGKVNLGLPARVFVEAYPDEPFEAELTRISPLGREEEDIINFEIRATIDDPEDRLRVGMSADAELILEKHEDVLIVPEGAILYEEEKAFVNVQDESLPEGFRKVRTRHITVGDMGQLVKDEGTKSGRRFNQKYPHAST